MRSSVLHHGTGPAEQTLPDKRLVRRFSWLRYTWPLPFEIQEFRQRRGGLDAARFMAGEGGPIDQRANQLPIPSTGAAIRELNLVDEEA
jgi:hypothetical protein